MTKKLGLIDYSTGVITNFRAEDEVKVHLNDLTREIKASEIIDTPVLPEETICYTQNGKIKVFFAQRSEALVPCQYRSRIYTLAWPVQIYGVVIDNLTPLEVCMHFAKKKIDHDYDEIMQSPLPNQHENGGRLCMGRGLVQEISGASSYAEVVKRVIHWIRTASFNDDLSNFTRKIPAEFAATVGGDESWLPGGNGDLFTCWEKWTQAAGDEWRTVNNLSWHRRAHFNEMRRGFRS